MRVGAVLLLLAVYGALDVPAIAVWRDDLSLWSHALDMTPTHERAMSNYAKARVAAGDLAWLPR